MLRDIIKLILKGLDEKEAQSESKSEMIQKLVKEIDRLEIKHIEALADVERWGDIDDPSNFRTVEYNKIGRILESKKKLLDKLL